MLTPSRFWADFDEFLRTGWDLSPLQLSVYRVVFGAYVLFGREVPELRWISEMPEQLHQPPPGLAQLFPASPPLALPLGLEIALAVSAAVMLVGFRTRSASILVGVLGLVSNSIFYSFGKIDHNILVWIVPLVLSGSGWGRRLSVDSSRGREGTHRGSSSIPVALMAMVVSFAFFTSALPKLAGGWLSHSRSATQRYFERQFVTAGRTDLLAAPFSELELTVFWEALDWITVSLEFAVALLFLWPKIWRISLAIAATFHLAVLLMMNISFESHYVVYLLFFMPLIPTEAIERALARMYGYRRQLLAVSTVLVTVGVVFSVIGKGLLYTILLDALDLDFAHASLPSTVGGWAVLMTLTFVAFRNMWAGRRF